VGALSFVVPGLVPGIHVFVASKFSVGGREMQREDALGAAARP
jgi:hypothetical protein